VNVFPTGAHIPSLVYVPPDATSENGTLIAFGQVSADNGDADLAARRSLDLGASWGPASFPVDEAAGFKLHGSHWAQPQSLYDPGAQSVLLVFTNSSMVHGGCDLGIEQLGGVLQVRSDDAGRSWSEYKNVQAQLQFPKQPLNCLAPTSGAGLVMRPVNGKYGGRLVWCAVRNAYQGDVPIWSDDGGETYNYSTSLYTPGLDECSIAQAANGSLFLIARNCLEANLTDCQMEARTGATASRVGGAGNHRFVYSMSHDGGETWSTPRDQPQMHTPVCEGSVISYQGPADVAPALYYSSPYSDTMARVNLTILASDDNGASFSRSLNLVPPTGGSGYTGLACGLPSEQDCAVLFDSQVHGLDFMRFSSREVK
jgi:sialidase-1